MVIFLHRIANVLWRWHVPLIPRSIRIGKYASIGANAVVLADVPGYAVAAGIPARAVRINRPRDIPDYHDF